jgi:prolyl 4-hydroxylase
VNSSALTVNDLGADIWLVERLLEPALCKHIIQVAECCQFGNAEIEVSTVSKAIRSNDLLRLEGNSLLQSTNQLLLDKINAVQQLLFQLYKIRFPHAEPCSVLRYRPGQYYKRHVDNVLLNSRMEEMAQGLITRDVSIVGYLNQACQGGETYFDRQDLKVQPQTGSVLVFPSYYTHPHQALSVTEGVKYAFTTWLFH